MELPCAPCPHFSPLALLVWLKGFHQQMHALRGSAARGHLWTMTHLVLQMSIIAVGVSNYLFVSSTFRPELDDIVHVSLECALPWLWSRDLLILYAMSIFRSRQRSEFFLARPTPARSLRLG